MIYFDNASTTRIDDAVLGAMMPYLTNEYGNAGTLYRFGRNAADAIAIARRQVADLVRASPEQIIFTSGGTEANNMVFNGVRERLLHDGKTHIITSQIEHDSVLKAVRNLTDGECIKRDFDASFVAPNEDGSVTLESIREAIRDNTGLVSVMHMNNETGVENPVVKIASLCRERRILFHTDAVQAAGSVRLDVNEIGCDFLSLSAHKIHAPKGVGALYVRDMTKIHPLIFGGASQEFGLRGGTENVAGIVGFGKACEMINSRLNDYISKVHRMKEEMLDLIKFRLTKCGLSHIFHINGKPFCNGKTLSLRFDGVDAETLLLMLDSRGVCVSAGSACRSHESEPSHVLLAMGIDEEDARNSIRISLSRMNTYEDISLGAETIVDCIAILLRKS